MEPERPSWLTASQNPRQVLSRSLRDFEYQVWLVLHHPAEIGFDLHADRLVAMLQAWAVYRGHCQTFNVNPEGDWSIGTNDLPYF